MVDEGIVFHDKGDYQGAMAKYDMALMIDKDNLYALTEKSFSLMSLEKYNESVEYCQKAIKLHPGEPGLQTVYVNYGNSLDKLEKIEEALAIYDEGIKLFPDFYQLHFNKGISLAGENKYNEALKNFHNSAARSPEHGSSHNAIGRLADATKKRIPAIMAYCRFLTIEPKGSRAEQNLANMQVILDGNVKKTGKKSITINIDPGMLGDTTATGEPNENSFTSTDLIMQMLSALDFDKKNKKETNTERFIRKIETMCASLGETKKGNYGFYWDFYAPYFIEMREEKLLETLGYICYASSKDPDVSKWLDAHQKEITKFYDWSDKFKWKDK